MNESHTQVLAEGLSALTDATSEPATAQTPAEALSQKSKLALMAKTGRTDLLILTLLAAEFGPQIQTGLSHVPGCG